MGIPLMEDRMDCFSYNTAILLGKEKRSELVKMGYKKGEMPNAPGGLLCVVVCP